MLENTVIVQDGDSCGGILDTDLQDFITHLRGAGYAQRTLRKKRSVLRAFTRWSRRRKWPVAALSEFHVESFLARSPRKRQAHKAFESAALRPFLDHLRRTGRVATTAPPVRDTPTFEWEQRYVHFLRDQRGLAERSVQVYAPHVHDLLLDLVTKHGSADPRELNPEMVHHFLLQRAQGRSSEWARLLAAALRSFFRFLHYRGETAIDFSVCVPTVRKWRLATVPAHLAPADVERALSVPDRATAHGRRDYAVLLLLARLGLRAGEVVALDLGDILWRTGEIIVHGKGGRRDHLPLPVDVGEAIVDYLRTGRGTSASRRVFLRSLAPHVALTGPAAIGHIVRKVLARAGISRLGRGAAHLFRHGLASRMIQHGANLSEIAEVLRHRSQGTTEIYAKVDLPSLREVARPWPGTGGGR